MKKGINLLLAIIVFLTIGKINALEINGQEYESYNITRSYVVGDYIFDLSKHNPTLRDLMLAAQTLPTGEAAIIEIKIAENLDGEMQKEYRELLSSENLEKFPSLDVKYIYMSEIKPENPEDEKKIIIDEALHNLISIYSDEIVTFQTKEEYGSKNIYPVFDFTSQTTIVDSNGLTPYSDKNLDNTMRTLKNMGFTRVYVVTHNQGIASLGNTKIKPIPDVKNHLYYEKNYDEVHGDFDAQFIKYIHKYGMEAIAIYKPYEGGGGTSFPLDETISESNTAYAKFVNQKTLLTGPTGKRTYFTDFIANNSELRVKRKYDEVEVESSKLPIDKVEMYFYRSAQDSTAAGGVPTLWVSDKNGEYEVYNDITYSYERVDNYIKRDVNGWVISNTPIIAYKLTININNLPQKYRYVAVSFDENSATMKYHFITYPFSMIKIYNGDTEIPSSISYFARRAINPEEEYSNHTWGYEDTPISLTYLSGVNYNNGVVNVTKNSNIANNQSYDYVSEAKYFNVWGFEFNYRSSGVNTTAGVRSPIWGIAAGKEEYIPGEICESEEAAKDYMVEEALAFYNKGYDGVELRYTSHSSVVTDYANYGYNDPIRDRYYEIYEKYPENEPKDEATQKKVAVRISEIRGDNFVDFMERVKDAKPKDKKLMIEIYATGYEQYLTDSDAYTPNDEANQIYNPSFAHIIFTKNKLEKLISVVDEITFRDNLSHEDANGKTLNNVGSEIIKIAQKYDKKLNVVCFMAQGNVKCPPAFFETIKNSNFDGVQLYELTEWRLFETGTNNFKSVINTIGDKSFNYNFLNDTTLQVNGNVTVETLIKNLNSIGVMHVLDSDNKVVAKTSDVANDMQLVIISAKNKYVFKIKVI